MEFISNLSPSLNSYFDRPDIPFLFSNHDYNDVFKNLSSSSTDLIQENVLYNLFTLRSDFLLTISNILEQLYLLFSPLFQSQSSTLTLTTNSVLLYNPNCQNFNRDEDTNQLGHYPPPTFNTTITHTVLEQIKLNYNIDQFVQDTGFDIANEFNLSMKQRLTVRLSKVYICLPSIIEIYYLVFNYVSPTYALETMSHS